MPALPAMPGVAKIIVKQTLATVNVYNVMHAYSGNPTGNSQAALDALAAAVRSAWVTNVIPLQATALTLTDVVAQDLSSDIGYASTATGSTAGTSGGTLAPANAAVCWSWKIPNRYRGGHPRTYIGGITAAGMSNQNTWLSTYITSHTNAANAIRNAINAVTTTGGTYQMGAISYYSGKDPATGKPALRAVPLWYTFTGVSVDTRIDSQRRRLGRDR